MSPEFVAVAMFGVLFLALFSGHPLAFSLGGVAVFFGLIGWGGSPDQVFSLFTNKTYGVMDEYVLVAVPLFIFMAQMLDVAGIAEALFNTMHVLWGPVRGGLAIAVLMVCVVFAASTGVVGATEVAIGLIAVPNLLKRGYDIPMTAGAICAGGTLGILIPPSIMLVIYGSLTNISVGKLFAAAYFPGFLLAAMYISYVAIRCGLNPEMGPPLPREERMHTSWAESVDGPHYASPSRVSHCDGAWEPRDRRCHHHGSRGSRRGGSHDSGHSLPKIDLGRDRGRVCGHLEDHLHGHDPFRGRKRFPIRVHGVGRR